MLFVEFSVAHAVEFGKTAAEFYSIAVIFALAVKFISLRSSRISVCRTFQQQKFIIFVAVEICNIDKRLSD